ncbi:hypothetical protein ABZ953_38095 [Streptomyces sp. NPDC046465]|uniref:hypothetical protein n=1 Tax=Streptomyces sp. NPDC046465 TaxID=3155810 RepID=UPI0033D2F89A
MTDGDLTRHGDWTERAHAVANALGARDGGAPPLREVGLLKKAGLVTLLGPAENGGAAQEWPVADRVVRIISAADAELGELLARHYVLMKLSTFIATEEKRDHIEEVATRAQWFFGGARDIRAGTLTIRDRGDDIVFDGRITPSTASGVSDITVLEGRLPDGSPISSLAMSTHVGLAFEHDEDGTVTVRDADIPWTGALGYVDKTFRPRAYNAFVAPALDLVLAEAALGRVRGLLGQGPGHPRTERELSAAERRADVLSRDAGALHRRSADLTAAEVAEHGLRVAELRAEAGQLAQAAETGALR